MDANGQPTTGELYRLIERLERRIVTIETMVGELREETAVLKTQAGIWGALAGFGTAAGIIVLLILTRVLK